MNGAGGLEVYQTATLTPAAYRLLIDLESTKYMVASSKLMKNFNVVVALPEPIGAAVLQPVMLLPGRKR